MQGSDDRPGVAGSGEAVQEPVRDVEIQRLADGFIASCFCCGRVLVFGTPRAAEVWADAHLCPVLIRSAAFAS